MQNGFIPVLSKLEELSLSLVDLDPEVSRTYQYLKCREGEVKRLLECAVSHARKHEITFILQAHESPDETHVRKAVKKSQEKVYQAIKEQCFDLVGLEGFLTGNHVSRLLEMARTQTGVRLVREQRHEINHAKKFCGAFRACCELTDHEVRAVGLEFPEAQEFQEAVLNLMSRRLRTRHQATTILKSFVGPARSILATALILALAEKEGFKKPALVMGQGHEGEFLALSLLWGFGAKLIDTASA